jgi:hypothetical protein
VAVGEERSLAGEGGVGFEIWGFPPGEKTGACACGLYKGVVLGPTLACGAGECKRSDGSTRHWVWVEGIDVGRFFRVQFPAGMGGAGILG